MSDLSSEDIFTVNNEGQIENKTEVNVQISSSLVETGEYRTATALSVFFILTTDILGPANAPYAFAQLGYFPGAILYLTLGVVATYTGLILWRLYVILNTPEKPLKTFCDLSLLIFGKNAYKAAPGYYVVIA